MKNQNGITLVAIVVSVIVMLILAGVSINLAIKEDGILENSKKAVAETELVEQKDYILETWAYVILRYESASLLTPSDAGKSAKDLENEKKIFDNILALYSKYYSNFGECKFLPLIGSYNDGEKDNIVMCVESKLKEQEELKTFYIVNDLNVYEKSEFMELYPDVNVDSMFRTIGQKKEIVTE